MKTLIGSLALALVLASCGGDSAPSARAATPDDVGASAGASSTVAPAPPAPTQTSTDAPAGLALSFSPPPSWSAVPTTVAMKRAQYSLAREAGDAEDADVTVFYVGPQGQGPAAAVLARWAKQFVVEGGGDPLAAMTQSQRRVGALAVTECELAGRFVAELPPGSGTKVDRPGMRLMGAIVESDHGPYYVRLLGPERTVLAHASEFREFISTLK